MITPSHPRLLLAILAICSCVLSACGPPALLARGSFAELSVAQARAEDRTGERVRWGGTIVTTTPEKDATCFEVVARPLDHKAQPRAGDETDGRFLTCAPGFYDPEVYAHGRELTAVGTLGAPIVRTIGEHEYRFPVLAAEAVHLWPKLEREWHRYDYPRIGIGFYDSFWGPYWGPGHHRHWRGRGHWHGGRGDRHGGRPRRSR